VSFTFGKCCLSYSSVFRHGYGYIYLNICCYIHAHHEKFNYEFKTPNTSIYMYVIFITNVFVVTFMTFIAFMIHNE
jgi:hypothetical protein